MGQAAAAPAGRGGRDPREAGGQLAADDGDRVAVGAQEVDDEQVISATSMPLAT